MKTIVGGRFEYMKVAWQRAVNEDGVIYFENETRKSPTMKFRCLRKLFALRKRLGLVSETEIREFEKLENIQEYIDVLALKRAGPLLFILYEMNVLSTDFALIDFLKKRFKNAKFVLFFTNIVGSVRVECTRELLNNRGRYDLIYTFNPNDARKYGFELFSGGAFPYDPIDLDCDEKYMKDVFWNGNCKGRYDKLKDVSSFLQSMGVTHKFIVRSDDNLEESEGIEITKEKIPYLEVLKYLRNCHCVLELENAGTMTIRWTEMIAYRKKMITDSKEACKMPLYNENQVQILSEVISSDFFHTEATKCIDPACVSTKTFISEIQMALNIQ